MSDEMHQEEPDCVEAEHDWQRIPGAKNPGDGGIIREVCLHCTKSREVETGATDPATGEQGIRRIRYAPSDMWSMRMVAFIQHMRHESLQAVNTVTLPPCEPLPRYRPDLEAGRDK